MTLGHEAEVLALRVLERKARGPLPRVCAVVAGGDLIPEEGAWRGGAEGGGGSEAPSGPGGWGRRAQHSPPPAPHPALGARHLPPPRAGAGAGAASAGGRWGPRPHQAAAGRASRCHVCGHRPHVRSCGQWSVHACAVEPYAPESHRVLPPAVTCPTPCHLHPARCCPHTHRAMSQASWGLPAGADRLLGFPLRQVVACGRTADLSGPRPHPQGRSPQSCRM